MSEQEKIDWSKKSWADLGLSGIGVSAAYLYKAAAPLDPKLVIDKYEYLEGLVAKRVVYEGMIIYVKDKETHFKYTKDKTWEEFNGGGSGNTLEFIELTLNSDEAGKIYEYGETVTVTTVTPKFNLGNKPITSIKIGTTSGGSELYRGETATSGTAIQLASDKYQTYSGTTGGTIYCTISDGKTTITKEAVIAKDWYPYYAVTEELEPAEYTWQPVGHYLATDIEITADAGQYICIASKDCLDLNAGHGICEYNEVGNTYNSPRSTYHICDRTLKNIYNETGEGNYHVYTLAKPRAKSGTAKFKLS